MNISDLKEMRMSSNLTNDEIAELSGIPVDVINDIFAESMPEPQYATLLAIEQVLATKEKIPFHYDEFRQEPVLISEEATVYGYSAREYEEEDIEKLSEWVRAELINGKAYIISAPDRMHQFLVAQLLYSIEKHIREKKGGCHVYPSPFDVRLFNDNKTIVQPDILVICNKDILTERGCGGAPDLVIEIVSKSNSSHDYITKMVQYQKAGVKEYWIVDPFQKLVTVYNFEHPQKTEQYTYEQVIPSGVLEGLEIRIEDVLGRF